MRILGESQYFTHCIKGGPWAIFFRALLHPNRLTKKHLMFPLKHCHRSVSLPLTRSHPRVTGVVGNPGLSRGSLFLRRTTSEQLLYRKKMFGFQSGFVGKKNDKFHQNSHRVVSLSLYLSLSLSLFAAA